MSMNPVTAQALRERLAQEEAAHASAIARRVEILGDLAQQNAIITAHEANIEAYRSDLPNDSPAPTPDPEPELAPAPETEGTE